MWYVHPSAHPISDFTKQRSSGGGSRGIALLVIIMGTTTSIRRHHPRVLRLAVGIVLGACFVMQQLKFEKAYYYHSSSASSSSSEISTSLMMLGDHHVLGGGESTGTRDKPLLLQVPYYVYAESPLHWMNFAFQEPTDNNNNKKKNKNGKKKKQQEQQSNTTTTTFTSTSTSTRRDDGTEYSNYKHSDDLWLSRASLRHPMRTHDPSQAKLFFVPLLLNAVASHDLCVQMKVQMKMNATPSASSSSSSSSSWKEECFIGGGFGGRGRKGGRIHKAYKWAHTYLEQSEYFQRNQGKDHVVVHSHYNTPSKNTRTDKPNLFRCNMINFEGHSPIPRGIKQQQQPPAGGGLRRTVIPAFRIGNPCPIQQQQQQQKQESSSSSAMIIGNNNNNYYATGVAEDKDTTTTTTTTTSRNRTHDFVMVASLHVGKKGFASRSDICQWLLEAKSSSSSASTTGSGNNNNDDNDTSLQQQQHSYSVSHCGEGQQCPALIQAKYGFHVRGDTLGSNRVMDLLLSRTIPLFTDPGQYDILPHVGDIPWKNFTYLVNVTTRESFDESLEWILSRPASEYHEMLRLIEEYRHIWDHTQIYQFDAYMAEFAKRLSLQ